MLIRCAGALALSKNCRQKVLMACLIISIKAWKFEIFYTRSILKALLHPGPLRTDCRGCLLVRYV